MGEMKITIEKQSLKFFGRNKQKEKWAKQAREEEKH